MGRYLLLFTLTLYPFCEVFPQKKDILFIINDDSIDFSEFKYVYDKNNNLREGAYERNDIEEYLDLYINFKLKVKEAEYLGYDSTAQFRQEYDSYKNQLARPYLTQEHFKDSLINQAYDRYKEIVKVSHILVRMEKDEIDTGKYYSKISGIHQKAIEGHNFEELAKRYSEEPNASTSGGSLGYFTSMQMVYPFENVAYNTEIGAVSDPFRTSFGYHILKVFDRRPNPGKVQVSHIMLRFNRNMTKEDSVNLEMKIESIYSDLTNSPNLWDSLCFQYSQDLRTKESGGQLNPFGVGEIIPIFAEKSFSITEIGRFSNPFPTPYGWHIVRLDSKFPIQSKEELLPELKPKVLRGDRIQAGKASSLTFLKEKYKYRKNVDIYSQLEEALAGKLHNINSKEYELIQNKTLFWIDTLAYNCQDLKDFITSKYSQSRIQDSTISINLPNEYNIYLNSQLESLEKQDLELNNLEYRNTLKEYREGMLLFEIMEDKIWNVASTDSIGLNSYYSSHLDQYTAFDSANLVIFEVDLTELDSIAFLSSTFKSKKKKEMKSEWVDIREWDSTSYEDIYSYTAGDSSLIGVAIKYRGKSTIPLNNIKGQVISDYQNDLESIWIQELYEKYGVIRNEKEIETAVEKLSNE